MMAGVTAYVQTNLVSDQAGKAPITDPELVNPWGIAVSPAAFWVANNGKDNTTFYTGDVNGQPLVRQSLVVQLQSGPTGAVTNSTSDFKVNGSSSIYLFSSESGQISAWTGGASAPVTVTTPNAVYKGIAIGNSGGQNFAYAADFHGGKIDVFDKDFAAATLAGHFTDPNLPAHYAPFNIQNVGGTLYVMYAQQDAQGFDELHGAGKGIVDAFDTSGNLVKRLVTGGVLNAPWGIAQAPANFGRFSNDLLIGNFGDGHINAFTTSGAYQGTMTTSPGHPLAIDGLWGLAFGNGSSAGDANSLYFTAGPDDEAHGLMGKITPNHAPVLDTSGDPTLNSTPEDAAPVETKVAKLLAEAVSDPDANALRGIAVTGADTTHGKWQFTIDNGTTWEDIGVVYVTRARLIPGYGRVRFVPDHDFNGTIKLYYRAWDQTQGVPGAALVNVKQVNTGGATAFSTALENASITVTPVNDAPVVTLSGTIDYTHDQAPITLAPHAGVSDIDSANFSGGTLRVRLGAADDSNRLSIGIGFTVDVDGQVRRAGTIIGQRTADGQGQNELVVTLNAAATPSVVQDLVRSITFQTVGGIASTRTVIFTVSDGDGGTSAEATKTVDVM
jgi:uncharacterized protein (TIGR03118 family)